MGAAESATRDRPQCSEFLAGLLAVYHAADQCLQYVAGGRHQVGLSNWAIERACTWQLADKHRFRTEFRPPVVRTM